MSTQQRTSGIALLVDWANEQDHWVRALAGAVLESRRALNANVIDELYEVLLNEKNLVEGLPITVAPLERDLEAGAAEQSLRLTRLSEVANVNALVADQEIAFNPRMTVLYGENGTGKTGYVRVLKQLASVRTAEPILPNISQASAEGAPRGSLSYELGDVPKSFVWSGEEGVPPFTRIDVFDARGVEIHVDGPLTYTYTPSELAVFRHTHEAIEAVKARLDTAKSATHPSGNPYLNKFDRDGKLYVKIETLGATTDIEELERLSNVPDAEKSQLEPLKERVDALRSGTSDAKLQLTESERNLLTGVKKTIETGRVFDVEAYGQATDAVAAAERAHTHATQEALSGQPIPGVLEDSWRRFVEAGEVYLQEHYADEYPNEGDSCPYCLQNLNAAALEIVRKYRAFCRSELQDAVQQARREVASLVDGVAKLELKSFQDDVRKRIGAAGEGRTPHASLVASYDALGALETVQTTVAKGEKIAAFDGQSRASGQGRDGGNQPAERSRQAGQRPKRRGGQAQRAIGDRIGKTTGPPRPDDARRIAPVDPQACHVCEMGLTSRHDSRPVSTAWKIAHRHFQTRKRATPQSQLRNDLYCGMSSFTCTGRYA